MKEQAPGHSISRKRIQYVLTWVALGLVLAGGTLLLAGSWNAGFREQPPVFPMVTAWVLLSASTIFLFLLAVKKAHRLLVDEERSVAAGKADQDRETRRQKKSAGEKEEFDFASTARKLVRRIPEDCSVEEAGQLLLKSLASEIEIMSGIFYIRRGEEFEPAGTYALASPAGPASFREGEGLTGQVARNQQVMVLEELPEAYLEARSGLGGGKPSYLAFAPLVQRNRTIAVVECCGYRYNPHEIENMLRIFARDVIPKLSDHSTK